MRDVVGNAQFPYCPGVSHFCHMRKLLDLRSQIHRAVAHLSPAMCSSSSTHMVVLNHQTRRSRATPMRLARLPRSPRLPFDFDLRRQVARDTSATTNAEDAAETTEAISETLLMFQLMGLPPSTAASPVGGCRLDLHCRHRRRTTSRATRGDRAPVQRLLRPAASRWKRARLSLRPG